MASWTPDPCTSATRCDSSSFWPADNVISAGEAFTTVLSPAPVSRTTSYDRPGVARAEVKRRSNDDGAFIARQAVTCSKLRTWETYSPQ